MHCPPNTARRLMRLDQTLRFAEYGLLPVELQQSENCKLKSKNVRDNNEKSNIRSHFLLRVVETSLIQRCIEAVCHRHH